MMNSKLASWKPKPGGKINPSREERHCGNCRYHHKGKGCTLESIILYKSGNEYTYKLQCSDKIVTIKGWRC